MARIFTSGLQMGHEQPEGMSLFGAAVFASDRPEIGKTTIKIPGGSIGSSVTRAYGSGAGGVTYWLRTFVWMAAGAITLTHGLLETYAGSSAVWARAFVDASGNLAFDTSAGGLVTMTPFPRGRRVMVEMGVTMNAAANDTFDLYVDGVAQMAQQSIAWTTIVLNSFNFGSNLGHNVEVDMWFGDMAVNDTVAGGTQVGRPGETKIYYLWPVGLGTAGTAEANWTKPGGGTTNKETSVDNRPPIFLADSTSGADAESMLRNPTNASSDLTLQVQSYEEAGIQQEDYITYVRSIFNIASNSATATTGNAKCLSNPLDGGQAITNFGVNGVASTSPSTWFRQAGVITYDPVVVREIRPEIRLNRAASALVTLINQAVLVVDVIPGIKRVTPFRAMPVVF